MKHTTQITLANRTDQFLAEAGYIKPEEVRQVTIEDAVVDTGATRLALPKPVIEQLGLTPVSSTPVRTTNGIVNRTIYSEVRFTVLEREGTLDVTELPSDLPVLVGHVVLELLDLCVDIKKGLIYNPEHDGEWIIDEL
ncbi:aspartyl protease [Candidatus Poribacteria bacterium]|nr:aspartyl protease [Candidatus Poribacteria bacterium]